MPLTYLMVDESINVRASEKVNRWEPNFICRISDLWIFVKGDCDSDQVRTYVKEIGNI
jgi:hypothetical protein